MIIKHSRKERDFKEDILKAISEPVRKKNYQIVLKNFPVKRFDAIEQNPGKDTNDFNCELNDGKSLKLEFKNWYSANWNNIPLEIYTDVDNNILGWPFKLSENNVDYIIGTWHGKKKECYIILDAKKLEKWWRENYQTYINNEKMKLNRPTNYNGNQWQSSFSWVLVKDIPQEIIYKHETFVDLNDFWNEK